MTTTSAAVWHLVLRTGATPPPGAATTRRLRPDGLREFLTLEWPGPWQEEEHAGGLTAHVYGSESELSALAELAQTLGAAAQLEPFEDRSWETTWLAALEPAPLGGRFLLAPSDAEVADETRHVLRYHRRVAFGDGAHDTTQLAVSALESSFVHPIAACLDVGAGNGVLSLVAAALGCPEVWAVELDGAAAAACRENVELNGFNRVIHVVEGSLPLPASSGSPRAFPLVVANIEAHWLIALAPLIAPTVAGDGQLLLTGLLTTQRDEVSLAFEAQGLVVELEEAQGDWHLLSLRRRTGQP